ncbi:MAG: hypothetical protein JO185_13200 [Acidobacteriaceae bacterium]|nr:hypothetical protein [Acidobacteriaceae bacterium]
MRQRASLFLAFLCATLLSSQPVGRTRSIGALENGARLIGFQSEGRWGLMVTNIGAASVTQSSPVEFEFYSGPQAIKRVTTGYETLTSSNGKIKGLAHVPGPGKSRFTVQDAWTVNGSVLDLSRIVTVTGSEDVGFMSAITFRHPEPHPRSSVEYFAPGMIYGSPAHLTASAIGGSETYGANGHGQVRIREDRLPAPMFGIRFEDGSALTVLDPAPDGSTIRADARDTEVRTLTDEHFRFGAIGADLDGGHHAQGFWFPGSEGEVTYRGNTYPSGQIHEWRRRYHPIRNGFAQHYRVQFRFSRAPQFPAYLQDAWRWAYTTLKPAVTWQDIGAVRRSTIDVLASQVQVRGDRAGIPNAVSAVPDLPQIDNKAIMGFTGENLEVAELLLADADGDSDKVRAEKHRNLGLAIFASFLRLKMNPPVGEGFNMETGEPALAIPKARCVFLRSFGDDMKATLRAYRRERQAGRTHKEWLAWVKQFGDWLLTQQNAEGGFPRSWKPVTGEVFDPSPQASYNAVPVLVLLTGETGDERYLQAGEKAADFVWTHGQSLGQFVGGTIDNPDILDKEAGTLSLEAYLALYEGTHDAKYLGRARAAANYAETYIYLWKVPMPSDEDDRELQWKHGIPTPGTQLIATGHSLVDEYMAFDVDEYAKLGRWTGDEHYLRVAKLLFHNTKNMTALPGRTFDLKGPGWQQEHFSFAPVRGVGLHRLWLPWVATSQLNGIFGLMQFDKQLFQRWCAPTTSSK